VDFFGSMSLPRPDDGRGLPLLLFWSLSIVLVGVDGRQAWSSVPAASCLSLCSERYTVPDVPADGRSDSSACLFAPTLGRTARPDATGPPAAQDVAVPRSRARKEVEL
jgi:hypothetical protein